MNKRVCPVCNAAGYGDECPAGCGCVTIDPLAVSRGRQQYFQFPVRGRVQLPLHPDSRK